MTLPKTPEGWASKLTSLICQVKDSHGEDRYPIRIQEVAKDYSKMVFPEAPLTQIDPLEGVDGFEGLLMPVPDGSGAWGIMYNASGKSAGRANFSVAHEFGHYLMHRQKYPKGKQCTTRDMLSWESEEAKIEAEANRFAANVLMPLDDFRSLVRKQRRKFDLAFFQSLAERYEVSLSAAILRWLGFTDERAMIVVGRDGFIDWAWSSRQLLRTGIFYRPKQVTTELPAKSLAAIRNPSLDNITGIEHPVGVWLGDETVKEMTLLTSEYNNMSISLLLYSKHCSKGFWYEEEPIKDTVDRFGQRFSRGD